MKKLVALLALFFLSGCAYQISTSKGADGSETYSESIGWTAPTAGYAYAGPYYYNSYPGYYRYPAPISGYGNYGNYHPPGPPPPPRGGNYPAPINRPH